MGQLEPVVSDRRVLLDQIEEYRDFLAGTPRGERDEFLPFFQARPQLAVFLGNLHSHIGAADHVAYEFPLWGDFVCDLVAGSRAHGAFVFAEFEDAGEKSLFNRVRRRRVSRWAIGSKAAYSRSRTGSSDWTRPAIAQRWSEISGPARRAPSGSSWSGAAPKSTPVMQAGSNGGYGIPSSAAARLSSGRTTTFWHGSTAAR